ncbi:contractile injection system tape measure protein [Enterobacter sp. UPMP2052]
MSVNICKAFCNVISTGQKTGERIASSSLLSAGHIKNALRISAQNIVISGEITVDKWVINLGVIPAAQFETLFIPRLAQAFAERLACEQASAAGQQAMRKATSGATASGMLPGGYHPDGEELIRLARGCLTPQTFKTLLQDSPVYQLQHLLKRLLEEAWHSPKMLPASWYGRVTADRLSVAAILYLLKGQQEHDWLMYQHAPTASQVAGWAKAIARSEIPPEQVVQLLTGNRPFDSISPGQPACPSLVVMRWLLPLWRQPAVRKVIHRLKGRQGVQRLDAYLSRCLQRQDDVMQAEKGVQSVPEQFALPQDDMVLSPDREMEPDARQIALSRDNTMLPECKGIPAASRRTMRPGKDGLRSPDTPRPSGQGISNAGLLLLWPLLPQLFSQLGLWAEAEFVSDAARWQAVYALDRLVRGEGNPAEERLTLNQMLCGVSCSASAPPTTPLSLLQLQQTDDWLTAIGQQLPGWEKLSPADIRQLFLQREGEISTEGAVPQISVWPQPWDFLLRDWPWPMTLASFPWTEQPLTIVWPLNGFTG